MRGCGELRPLSVRIRLGQWRSWDALFRQFESAGNSELDMPLSFSCARSRYNSRDDQLLAGRTKTKDNRQAYSENETLVLFCAFEYGGKKALERAQSSRSSIAGS